MKKSGLPKQDYLYFIQAGGPEGPIKIGHSTDPADRISKLGIGNALELRLLAQFAFEPNAESFEQKLHRAFWDLRIRGEWFRSDPRIHRLIREMQLVEERNRGTEREEVLRIRSIDERGEDFR